MEKNLIPLSEIYIPPEEDARIREPESLKKAVAKRTPSLIRHGQMQPILVEELEAPIDGKLYKLIDGQTRMVAMAGLTGLYAMGDEVVKEAFERWRMKPGHIEATTRENLDPIQSLMMEFHANEDRENLTWEERGRYIRRVHDMLQNKYGRKEWKAKNTAEYIDQSEATVSQYLQLTDERDPATQVAAVKKATSKKTAIKQLKIEKERRLRKARVESAKKDESGIIDIAQAAALSVYHGDCREWIKKIPDNSLDWFHWDPPYGGKEGEGGAFASQEPIETEHEYFMQLTLEMLPEIWRVLHDGSWIAMWYTPVHQNWLRLALQGHRFDEGGTCIHCEKHITKDHAWLSSNYSCRPSPYRFWVNPYPNIWLKADRKADGHEITRFLTKETEFFFLAGKQDEKTPILLRSDRGNVFTFNSVPREARRHVNHKPFALITEILSLISVPGSLGGDAGGGSGSSIEGAYSGGRKILVAELNEKSHIDCMDCAVRWMTNRNLTANSLAPWLTTKFRG